MDFGNLGGTPQPQSNGVLNLTKGGVLDLVKVAPSLKRVILGCGWDVANNGPTADLDLSATLVPKNARISGENVTQHVVFYNNPSVQGVRSTGDNRTGVGEGDDEQIVVELDNVAPEIEKIIFVVTIYDAQGKSQLFGMVKNAFARLVNEETNEELCRYELSNDYSTDTCIEFCSLNRTPNGWQFEAVGKGSVGDLNSVLAQYM